MRNNKYITLIFVAAAVIACGIFVWKVADNNGQSQPTSQAGVQKAPVTEVSYDGVAGKNALVLLKSQHQVETKTFKGLGEEVTGIDGVKADSKHFWSFNVNGKEAAVGAGSYTTKAGDKIVWKLEAIQ